MNMTEFDEPFERINSDSHENGNYKVFNTHA